MSEIKTTKIIGETGVDAVNFTSGLNVTGVSTATNVSTASSITAGTFYGYDLDATKGYTEEEERTFTLMPKDLKNPFVANIIFLAVTFPLAKLQ